MQSLAKPEAQALVSAHAYTAGQCRDGRRFGEPEPAADATGQPRTVIHTVTGMLRGADWDLDTALAFIDAADTVGWEPHIVGHDLVARQGGQAVRFDVPRERPE